MPRCSVVDCRNTSKIKNYKDHGITYHRFPVEAKIKEKWINATGRSPSWFPQQLNTICSSHFDEKCFQPLRKSRRLFEWATPTKKLRLRRIYEETQYHAEEQPSTSTAGVSKKAAAFYEKSVASLLGSDDEDTVESEQETAEEPVDVHYTSSKESQKGKIRLSAGSLFPETPTFSLTQELVMDLHELSDKIQNFYPATLGKQFTLTFQGEDGDKSEYIFTSASEIRRRGERHNSLRCNECGSDIVGFRYKCVSCTNYDLCSACESLGLHADHLMMRIAKPIKLKKARMLLQQWCKAMKAVGITTAEELTRSRDEEPLPEPKQPPSSSGKSQILKEPTLRNTSSTKAAKGKGTSKGKAKATMKSAPVDAPKKKEAKKRKIDDAREGDDTIVTDVAIKQETLEDFYQSLSVANEAEIFIPTEEIKTDDPDPLGTDKIKIEIELISSSTPPGDPGPDTITSEHPGPAAMAAKNSGPSTITSEYAGPASTVGEHSEPSAATSEHPGPATTTSGNTEPASTTSEHTGPATTISEHTGPTTTTSGHTEPATTTSGHTEPASTTSGHTGPATTTPEDPAVRFQTFTHRTK